MKHILVVQGGGRPNGNTAQLAASFVRGAQEDPDPPFGRYEKYPVKDRALLMTAADNFFWTFEQAVSWYRFALVRYIGFQDKGMILAGGCGDPMGSRRSKRHLICRKPTNSGGIFTQIMKSLRL